MAGMDASTAKGLQPGIEDSENLEHWRSLAQNYWLKSIKAKKVNPDVIKKEIWDVLQAEGFEFRSLQALDNLQLLEKYESRKSF